MAENSKIEWTDHTVNFWWGCEKVSAACAHCYAERQDAHFHPSPPWRERFQDEKATALHWGHNAPRLLRVEAAIQEAMRYQRRAAGAAPWTYRVFTNSMSDFFEDRRDLDAARLEALDTMRRTPNLRWMILTKRPEKIMDLLDRAALLAVNHPSWDWLVSWINGKAPANIWLGTTVEDQERADQRIPALLAVPAAVRFVSCEPLLGPVHLFRPPRPGRFHASPHGWPAWLAQNLHMVIVGGESGPHARPMHPDWVRSLRAQCVSAPPGIPFFFKQWGEWSPLGPLNTPVQCAVDYRGRVAKGGLRQNFPPGASSADRWHHLYRVGKARAGRLLDGVEHSEFPKDPSAPLPAPEP